MIRSIAWIGLLMLAAAPAAAQLPPPIRLTVDPMASSSPALKYSLLPQVRDRQRGNALLLYYRAFSPEWQTHRRTPKYLDKVIDANAKPLRDLTGAEIDALIGGFVSGMLKEVDRGARRTYCDWELNQRLKEDGIGLLLPDLQSFREMANLLKVRARQELLAGQYNKAARTLQTGLALARHTTEGPTLIHSLVGIACASTMLSVIDDWVERPGAPNLYWALTDLPRPLMSIRNGLEGERITMDWICPGGREWLDDPSATPALAQPRMSLQMYIGLMEWEPSARPWGQLLTALRSYPRAKRFLRQNGRTAEQVEAMPALQAVFLYEVHQYDVDYDDLRKWANLPYAEAAPHIRRAVQRAKDQSKQEALPTLAALLLPAVDKVMAAPVRVARKIAALRCVEALRLYAAAHNGKLPARLDDVTEVPIPIDPMTGKSFAYRLEANKAVLTAPAPAGEPPQRGKIIQYELTVRTTKGK